MSFLSRMLKPFKNPLNPMGMRGGGANPPPRNPLDTFKVPGGQLEQARAGQGGGQLTQALNAYRNQPQRMRGQMQDPRFDDGDTGQMPGGVMAKPAINFDPKGGMSNGMPNPIGAPGTTYPQGGNTGIVPPEMQQAMQQSIGMMQNERQMQSPQGGGFGDTQAALQAALGGNPGANPPQQPADFNPRQAFGGRAQASPMVRGYSTGPNAARRQQPRMPAVMPPQSDNGF